MFEHGDERYTQYLKTGEIKGLGIQIIRKLVGITQEELAESLGVSPSAVSKWETGKAGVSSKRIREIAKILGVHPHRILNPTKEEIEMASHIALKKGSKIKRMVLEVNHGKHEQYPSTYIPNRGVVDAEELDRFIAQSQERNEFPYDFMKPVPNPDPSKYYLISNPILPKYLIGEYTNTPQFFGPKKLFAINYRGTHPGFTRIPTFKELAEMSLSKDYGFCLILRCFMRVYRVGKHKLSKVTGISVDDIEFYMTSSGYNLKECPEVWDDIVKMEDALKLTRCTLLIFTPAGRKLLRDGIIKPT